MERLEALWKYQQVDMKASALEHKLKNSDVRKRLVKARNYLMEAQQNLKKMEAETGELRVAFETAQNKVEGYQDEIDAVIGEMHRSEDTANLAAVERMRKTIMDLRDQLTRQEHGVQSILDSLNHIDENMKRIMTGIPKAKSDFDQLKKVYDAEVLAVGKETEPFREQMQEMEKEIDPALLERYKGIRKTRVNPIAQVVGDQCMGCNMELPSIARKKLTYDSDEILECDNCGRLLYVKEG